MQLVGRPSPLRMSARFPGGKRSEIGWGVPPSPPTKEGYALSGLSRRVGNLCGDRAAMCSGSTGSPAPLAHHSRESGSPCTGCRGTSNPPSTWWRVNDNRVFQCQDQDRQISARNRFDKVDSRVRGNGSLSAQRVTSRQFNSRRWLGRMVRGPHHERVGGAQR